MDKLTNHSLTDWDISTPYAPVIVSDKYISTPSALCGKYVGAAWKWGYLFLKQSLSGNLVDGRFVTWIYPAIISAGLFIVYFRAQALPPVYDQPPLNCYYADIMGGQLRLYKVVAGAKTLLGTFTLANGVGNNVWTQIRYTWWQYINEDLITVLRIGMDVLVSGAWVNQFYYNNVDNLWAGSATNRIGFFLRSYNNVSFTWIDDTEIWKPAV